MAVFWLYSYKGWLLSSQLFMEKEKIPWEGRNLSQAYFDEWPFPWLAPSKEREVTSSRGIRNSAQNFLTFYRSLLWFSKIFPIWTWKSPPLLLCHVLRIHVSPCLTLSCRECKLDNQQPGIPISLLSGIRRVKLKSIIF